MGNSRNSGISNNKGNSTLFKDKSSAPGDVDIYSNIDKRQISKEIEKEAKIDNVANENIMPSFDPFKETKLSFF